MKFSPLKSVLNLFRQEDGNIAIMFCAAALPLVLIMGGAIDLVRFNRYKEQLASAVDAAALALAREDLVMTDKQATEFIQDYVAAHQVGDREFDVRSLSARNTGTGFEVTAEARMDTIFLPLSAIPDMDLGLTATVERDAGRIELALVLDNTGSMNCAGTVSVCALQWKNPEAGSRIAALKAAASSLVNNLMRSDLKDPDQIKIAIVPFESQVNVASAGFDVANPPAWIDWQNIGKAKYNGVNFDRLSGNRIGHRYLFNQLKADISWAGCVEMRAGTYELTDAAPNPGIPDSLFVPFFWPDEPDDKNDGGKTYTNNYLVDKPSSTNYASAAAQTSLAKFTSAQWQSGKKDNEGTNTPYESGPNHGCPKPIVPLRNASKKQELLTAIDGMIAYWASGTYIPAGLIWGWHVLSSGEPYTEGLGPNNVDFDETVKAIVLLTDGDNTVYGSENNHNKSRFSAYGYVGTQVSGTYRLGSTATAAETALNQKTATLCTNVKGSGIRLYTITFGSLDAATQTLMTNCATVDKGKALYFHAPNSSQLMGIFNLIKEDLLRIHLSK